jgi:hypothetical protein
VLLALYVVETALFGSYLESGGFIAQDLISHGLLLYTIFMLSLIPQVYLVIRLWEKAGIVILLYGITILFPVVLHNAFLINKYALAPWMSEHVPVFFT